MTATANHPCFSCTLPDCDDENRHCGLRRALGTYRSFLDRREDIPAEVRQAGNIAYHELYGDRHRELLAARYQRNKLAAANVSNGTARSLDKERGDG